MRSLLVGMAFGVCTDAAAVDVPPIRYTGEFLTTLRFNKPDVGAESTELGSSAFLRGSSYLWQPWFATLDGGLALSQFQTYADSDTSSTIASGDLSLSVFPRSRFPFTAFVDLDDSRQEFDTRFVEQRDRRLLRYGVRQRYRPLGGSSSYSLLLERRDEEVSGPDSFDESTNRAELEVNYRLKKHSINARVSVEDTTREQPGLDVLDFVATVQHGYRPTDTLTIDNFASVEDISVDGGPGEFETTSLQLTSFAAWTPRDSKLRVDGDVQLSSDETVSPGQSTERHDASASVTARYEWSPSVRVTGTLRGSVIGGDTSSNTTSQSVSVSYVPEAIDLRGFQYNHSAFASASNRTSSIDDDVRNLTSGFSHGLSRSQPFGAGNRFNLSGNINQSVSVSVDSDTATTSTLTHSGSIGLAHAVGRSSSRVVLIVQDSRNFGGDDDLRQGGSELQTANLQAQHDSRFGRFANLSATANLNWIRQNIDGDTQINPSSSFALAYLHGRFLGVRRLRFRSTLEAQSDSLSFVEQGDEGIREIEFENTLEYSIGRVDAELKLNMTDTNGRLNSFLFFSLKRRLAGVL